tara:strand:+ start:1033 stop:1539 length:507 start_codon:yes stop_codon:yes gene_type:complete
MVSNLKVDKIQSVAGTTTAMTFDSSGHVLTPARPAFSVRRTANQDFSGSGYHKAEFPTAEFNIGNHYDTSNSKFTCPVAGVYLFAVHAYIYTSDNPEVNFYINGTNKARMANQLAHTNVNPNSANGTKLFNLSANDEVEVYIYTNQASSMYWGGTDTPASFFCGYLVG